jgi:hypothetical protein
VLVSSFLYQQKKIEEEEKVSINQHITPLLMWMRWWQFSLVPQNTDAEITVKYSPRKSPHKGTRSSIMLASSL